jgi:hydroxylamine dehydrogenase
VISGVALAAQAQADFPTVPKETDIALKIDRSV